VEMDVDPARRCHRMPNQRASCPRTRATSIHWAGD
jgi:hypothetical protein